MEHSYTTGSLNITTIETLESVNDKLSRLFMGPLIIVAAMMVTGIFGNLHVLLFYSTRMKPTNHRDFIVFLSLLDLTVCIVGMPLAIYTLNEPLLYATRAMCKLFIFINYFISIASGFTLLVIAFERYRKVCKPCDWQLSRRCAKMTCLLVLTAALVCSMPILIMTDIDEWKSTKYPWISAKRCKKVDRNIRHYLISLVIISSFSLIALIVLYTMIWKVISTLAKNLRTKDPVNNKRKETEMSSSRRQISRSRKLTLAFSLITTVFFLSYIPYLVLFIVYNPFHDKPYDSELTVVFSFAYFSGYVSSTTNCFIYGFTNLKFRHEVKILYKKLFCCK